MNFLVSLTVRNPTNQPVRVVVEEGTIFEVIEVNRNSPQTLKAIEETEFSLDPGKINSFDIEAECLNPNRRAPDDDPMQLTQFILE